MTLDKAIDAMPKNVLVALKNLLAQGKYEDALFLLREFGYSEGSVSSDDEQKILRR